MLKDTSPFDLTGRVAVVTGGSRGIGMGIAESLVRAGAIVVIANRRQEEGEQTAEMLRQLGGVAVAIPTDITARDSIAAMAEEVVQRFEHVDIVVCNAGVTQKRPIQLIEDRHWHRVVDVNLRGTFNTLQVLGQRLMEQRSGRVICVGSVLSGYAEAGRVLYGMTKGGILMMTRVLAVEWAPYGITVNALCPGTVLTKSAKTHYEQRPNELAAQLERIPLRRFANPAEMGNVAVFLASDAASYVTGQAMYVDGGWTCAAMPAEWPASSAQT